METTNMKTTTLKFDNNIVRVELEVDWTALLSAVLIAINNTIVFAAQKTREAYTYARPKVIAFAVEQYPVVKEAATKLASRCYQAAKGRVEQAQPYIPTSIQGFTFKLYQAGIDIPQMSALVQSLTRW